MYNIVGTLPLYGKQFHSLHGASTPPVNLANSLGNQQQQRLLDSAHDERLSSCFDEQGEIIEHTQYGSESGMHVSLTCI